MWSDDEQPRRAVERDVELRNVRRRHALSGAQRDRSTEGCRCACDESHASHRNALVDEGYELHRQATCGSLEFHFSTHRSNPVVHGNRKTVVQRAVSSGRCVFRHTPTIANDAHAPWVPCVRTHLRCDSCHVRNVLCTDESGGNSGLPSWWWGASRLLSVGLNGDRARLTLTTASGMPDPRAHSASRSGLASSPQFPLARRPAQT